MRSLTFVGNVSDDRAVAALIEAAEALGYRLVFDSHGRFTSDRPPVASEQSGLAAIDVVALAYPAQMPPSRYDHTRRTRARRLCGANAAELANMSIAEFIARFAGCSEEEDSEQLDVWLPTYLRIFTRLLTVMRERGLSFADANPVELLQTPIEELNLSGRAFNSLAREGVGWVEMLPLLSAAELLRIRNFGTRSLDNVVEALAGQGLRLRQG